MSTTTKTRKRGNLAALVGPLDVSAEPKTLAECLHEAGGFPFVASIICDVPAMPGFVKCPVGAEYQLIGGCPVNPQNFAAAGSPLSLRTNIKRWQLLGHKT